MAKPGRKGFQTEGTAGAKALWQEGVGEARGLIFENSFAFIVLFTGPDSKHVLSPCCLVIRPRYRHLQA